jgi:AcrR family transcriptional regulator
LRDILVKSPLKAVSKKGNQRIRQILLAALEVLIRHGYHAFTMREVAAQCGISVGNLNYYYRSKAGLLTDLIDSVWRGYEIEFDRILHDTSPHDPERALQAVIRLILDDLATRETTVFFPELWAMANHDSEAAKRLDQIYGKVRQVMIALIPQINPTLDEVEVSELAIFLSASLEGHTMFVGYRKPWSAHRKQISNIAVKGLLELVRNVRPEHYRG